ncbi:ribosome recycling factor, partial [Candidatus Uhrbacteria bacterium]|nr:ribosome recycling factor [Candidatus Uhrbacteria bacterium]MBD3284372.1 ribosome recycling factor [Candidatus Uhrbacteria bacterium]
MAEKPGTRSVCQVTGMPHPCFWMRRTERHSTSASVPRRSNEPICETGSALTVLAGLCDDACELTCFMSTILDQYNTQFQNVADYLENELHTIRTGRAQSAVVESIPVEAYGSTMELKGVAAISVPDAKT